MCDYITAKDPNHGYACECHNITAPDGFIMQTARIPATGKASSKPPVFLMHGFITTGLDFVFQPEVANSLPYLLADAGYDVWIGNERGNVFAAENAQMDINSEEFWDAVDVDNMAKLDVPAIFDYVLKASGAAKMHWVGHSQGGGMMVLALANRPELQQQLGKAVLLAPGVHMQALNVTLLKGMAEKHLDEFWYKFGFDIPGVATHRHYFPGPSFQKIMEFFTAYTPLCRLPKLNVTACNDIGKLIGINVGDPNNLEAKTMADAYGYDPGGSSFHLIMHWSQKIRNDTLVEYEFDWGAENPKHYNGSTTPPKSFDLSNIKGVDFALFDGGLDLFITPGNIQPLLNKIQGQNRILHKTIDNYAHMDFVWGKDAHIRLYPDVIDFLSADEHTSEVIV